MTQATTVTRTKAHSDIYTVLIFIALLVLAAGVIFVAYRHNVLFGGNPFELPQAGTTQ